MSKDGMITATFILGFVLMLAISDYHVTHSVEGSCERVLARRLNGGPVDIETGILCAQEQETAIEKVKELVQMSRP